MTPTTATAPRTSFDVLKVRADFPILSERVHGKPLVYLDSANTSQKPQSVIEAMDSYYRHANANIHRATHLLSERATAFCPKTCSRSFEWPWLRTYVSAASMVARP